MKETNNRQNPLIPDPRKAIQVSTLLQSTAIFLLLLTLSRSFSPTSHRLLAAPSFPPSLPQAHTPTGPNNIFLSHIHLKAYIQFPTLLSLPLFPSLSSTPCMFIFLHLHPHFEIFFPLLLPSLSLLSDIPIFYPFFPLLLLLSFPVLPALSSSHTLLHSFFPSSSFSSPPLPPLQPILPTPSSFPPSLCAGITPAGKGRRSPCLPNSLDS